MFDTVLLSNTAKKFANISVMIYRFGLDFAYLTKHL